jgi:hypothetical protein
MNTNTRSNAVAAFLFKGGCAEKAAVTELEKSTPKVASSKDDIEQKVSLALLDDEDVAIATRMAPVYIAIASFENSVRSLVTQRLVERIGANWWGTISLSADIKNRSETRQKEEEKIRWHQARGLGSIYFTELHDLASIIRANWPHFEDLLHDMDWVTHVIKTLERSRNVIMHSGQLSMDDIDRVGVTIRDWLRQVGG